VKRARYAFVWIVLLCCVAARAEAQREPQVRVELSADKSELPVNDNVTVRVYVQANGAGQPDIEVPEFEGFQIVQKAVQRPMQFSFGFGQSQPVVTSTTQYTFVLVPTGAGTFKIPPVKVTMGQRVFQSKPLVLTVTGQAQGNVQQQPQQLGAQPLSGGTQPEPTPSGNAATPAPQASGDVSIYDNEAFLRTVVDKLEPYEGEQVTSTIYLYTRHNLQQVPAVQAEASTDGFWVQDLLSATRSLEPTRQVINGRGFWVYVLRRFAAFPLKSGELTIGSMALTISRETMFDLFNPTSAPAEAERKSVPVLLKVKALPSENRPAGPVAVGSFEIKSTLDRAQVATGDAVTWTATLRGRGNLRAIKLPDPTLSGLQVLQPEVHDLTETPQDRVQSTRTFAWLVVPQQPGTYNLPTLSLDTFDPASGTYKRISSERLTLTAAGAAAAGSVPSVPSATDDKANARGEDADERNEAWPPLHAQSALSRARTPISAHSYYSLLLLLWPLLWLGVSFGPSGVARLRSRGQGTAEQVALRNAHQRLKRARDAHGGNDPRLFHAEISAALNMALEARLGENVSGLTQSQLRRRLAELGVADKLSTDVCEVLSQCDFARFSSAAVNADEMQRILARAEHVWEALASFSPQAQAHAHANANAKESA
jgi:hypothetical protein